LAYPLDELIVGLCLMNAFFCILFHNKLFQRETLNWLRCRFQTLRGRLLAGLGAAVVCGVDDAAAGGVLNRMYHADLSCEGVSERTKKRELLMILVAANSIAALIPWSSWMFFYQSTFKGASVPFSSLKIAAFSMYPVMMMGFLAGLSAVRSVRVREGNCAVFRCDFLTERVTCTSWVMVLLASSPLIISLVVLLAGVLWWQGASLGLCFLIGIACSVAIFFPLMIRDRYISMRQQDAVDNRLARGVRCLSNYESRTRLINQGDQMMGYAREERVIPPLSPGKPVFPVPHLIATNLLDGIVKNGVKEMVSGLIRVMILLALAGLVHKSMAWCPPKNWILMEALERVNTYLGFTCHPLLNFRAFAVMVVLLLVLSLLRVGGFSSAWGVIAMIFPSFGPLATAIGLSEAGQEMFVYLIFGTILSFGVWANQTLPTGDSVELSAEIQGRSPSELANLSSGIGKCAIMITTVMALLLSILLPWLSQLGVLWATPLGVVLLCMGCGLFLGRQEANEN
jgi:hypothetical protein